MKKVLGISLLILAATMAIGTAALAATNLSHGYLTQWQGALGSANQDYALGYAQWSAGTADSQASQSIERTFGVTIPPAAILQWVDSDDARTLPGETMTVTGSGFDTIPTAAIKIAGAPMTKTFEVYSNCRVDINVLGTDLKLTALNDSGDPHTLAAAQLRTLGMSYWLTGPNPDNDLSSTPAAITNELLKTADQPSPFPSSGLIDLPWTHYSMGWNDVPAGTSANRIDDQTDCGYGLYTLTYKPDDINGAVKGPNAAEGITAFHAGDWTGAIKVIITQP